MVPTVNLLSLIGLAHPLANLLNKHAENKRLWMCIGGGAMALNLMLMLGIFVQCFMLTNGIGHSGILLTLLGSFMAAVTLIDVLQLADGYLRNKELALFPGGAWVMLRKG